MITIERIRREQGEKLAQVRWRVTVGMRVFEKTWAMTEDEESEAMNGGSNWLVALLLREDHWEESRSTDQSCLFCGGTPRVPRYVEVPEGFEPIPVGDIRTACEACIRAHVTANLEDTVSA